MDDKIIVRHSSIMINNYEIGDAPKLENTFSVWDPVYFLSRPKGLDYDPDNKILYLPRGIDVGWVERTFNEQATLSTNPDPYHKFGYIGIKYMPRDDRQREALLFMTAEGQYKSNVHNSQLSVNLNTGAGKTYCSIATMAYLGIRSIIITSSVGWLEQWKKCALEYTDMKPNDIYFIEGSGSILRLLNKSPEELSQIKLLLVTHNTLKSYGDNAGWQAVGDLFRYLQIGLKFYDEAHLNFDNMCKIDFYTNTYRTYYVTATPARSNREENVIFNLYFKNVPAIDLFDDENDPRTSYTALLYESHLTPQETMACKNQYGLDRNRYTNIVVHKEDFKKVLHIVMNKFYHTPGKILIYIGTNEAIKVVYDWIYENYPELIGDVGIYTSQTTGDKQEQLQRHIILSTTKSCGAAVDIKNLKLTIVLAEPFKSEVLARQTLGRTRDRGTQYIELVDYSSIYTKKFYYAKKPIFNKYATSCSEIKMVKNTLLDDKVETILEHRNNYFPMVYYIDKDKLPPMIKKIDTTE